MSTTITVPAAGDPVQASWGSDVASAINAIQEDAEYLPFAFNIGAGPQDATSTVTNMVAGGAAILTPIFLAGTMLIQSITLRNGDTASARTCEMALYRDNGSGTLTQVTGTYATLSFTPSAASDRTANVATPGTELRPGIYWLCVRNSHATNTFGLRRLANATEVSGTACRSNSTGIAALGATLDPITNFSTNLTGAPYVRLNGRVFGEAAAF